MSDLSHPVFTFRLDNEPADTFDVVSFRADEGMSRLYAFDVLLLSRRDDLDPAAVLQDTAHLKILPPFAPENGLEYTGIPASFEVLHRMGDRHVYRICVRHKLWWLTLVRQNRVFLDVSPVEACTRILDEADLHARDYAWKCRQRYAPREFICQYDESDFAFLSRWLERLGICYWFEQTPSGPCCVLADDEMAHTPLPGNETCDFSEPSGLNPENPGQVITDFRLFCSPLPREVRFQNYNPQKPDLDLNCSADVSERGRGTFYRYGDNYASTDEGNALAQVEAEALRCRAEVFSGLSHNPALRPGHTFTLRRHFRSAWNRQYLTTDVRHEGSQARLVARVLGRADGLFAPEDADRLFYRNSFSCIPATTRYRAARTTPWPRIAGSIPAHIDGQGSGAFPELDGQGRYKVVLPFDLAKHGGGKASCWIRMMQPYAGAGMGFHAPLHKGTEVMLSFVGGDPDQPVITGAVPNPVTPSPVTDANATQINLHSAAGQKLSFEDAPGKEHILLSSPDGGTFIKIGVCE